MVRYIVEFMGTFFLVFTVGSVVVSPGAGLFAPLAVGGVLAAMVYAGGHVSGAHYNPAVTISVWLRGKLRVTEVFPYMGAQVVAAVLAAHAVLFFKGDVGDITMEISVVHALVAEFLFTFALCLVILEVATSRRTEGNSYYGIAIGFTVMAGAYAVGGVSGAAFNPAVAVGAVFMGLCSSSLIWVYLVANFAGGIAAAVVFKFLDACPDQLEDASKPQ